MKKKLDIFHKLLLLVFAIYVILFILPIEIPYDIFAPSDGIYKSFFHAILPFAAFLFLILILFVAGCIKAKLTKKTRTISLISIMLILFFYVLPFFKIFPPILLLIIIVALTRKYWAER